MPVGRRASSWDDRASMISILVSRHGAHGRRRDATVGCRGASETGLVRRLAPYPERTLETLGSGIGGGSDDGRNGVPDVWH
jgi:hypothetical protein